MKIEGQRFWPQGSYLPIMADESPEDDADAPADAENGTGDDDAEEDPAIRIELRPSPELVEALENDVYPVEEYPELTGTQDRFVRAAGDVVRLRRRSGSVEGVSQMSSGDLERLLAMVLERSVCCADCMETATESAIEAVE